LSNSYAIRSLDVELTRSLFPRPRPPDIWDSFTEMLGLLSLQPLHLALCLSFDTALTGACVGLFDALVERSTIHLLPHTNPGPLLHITILYGLSGTEDKALSSCGGLVSIFERGLCSLALSLTHERCIRTRRTPTSILTCQTWCT
jgi:hypothetical protein